MKYIIYVLESHENGSRNQKTNVSKNSPPTSYPTLSSDRMAKLQISCHSITSSA